MSATKLSLKCPIHFRRGNKGRVEMKTGKPEVHGAPAPAGRVPKVARLMALAIKFDGMLQRGEVRDDAELARLGHVTRARVTQIMNLLNLAPDLQEAILFLPEVERGRDPLKEWQVRPVAAEVMWVEQRRRWINCRRSTCERSASAQTALAWDAQLRFVASASGKAHRPSSRPHQLRRSGVPPLNAEGLAPLPDDRLAHALVVGHRDQCLFLQCADQAAADCQAVPATLLHPRPGDRPVGVAADRHRPADLAEQLGPSGGLWDRVRTEAEFEVVGRLGGRRWSPCQF